MRCRNFTNDINFKLNFEQDDFFKTCGSGSNKENKKAEKCPTHNQSCKNNKFQFSATTIIMLKVSSPNFHCPSSRCEIFGKKSISCLHNPVWDLFFSLIPIFTIIPKGEMNSTYCLANEIYNNHEHCKTVVYHNLIVFDMFLLV